MPGTPAINITYIFRPTPLRRRPEDAFMKIARQPCLCTDSTRHHRAVNYVQCTFVQGSNAAVRQNRSAINRYRYSNVASSQRIDGRSMQASSGNKNTKKLYRNLFCHSLYQTKLIAQFFFWAIILSFLTRGLNFYLILHYTICRHSDSPPDLHRNSSQN